jgi:hypothetical protein
MPSITNIANHDLPARGKQNEAQVATAGTEVAQHSARIAAIEAKKRWVRL